MFTIPTELSSFIHLIYIIVSITLNFSLHTFQFGLKSDVYLL